jgi:hypothetical protein
MKTNLRYQMIVQPGGLPLFSQSLNFKSDFECQTFENRIKSQAVENRLNKLEINSVLLGGLFEAIKDLFAELIEDRLKLIDVELLSYRITGLVHENLLIVGIFNVNHQEEPVSKEEYTSYLGEIANGFTNKYPSILTESYSLDFSIYDSFEEDLTKMGFSIALQDCRNCLRKYADENKKCIPHLFYFKENSAETTS